MTFSILILFQTALAVLVPSPVVVHYGEHVSAQNLPGIAAVFEYQIPFVKQGTWLA